MLPAFSLKRFFIMSIAACSLMSTSLPAAEAPLKLCALYPHLKDSYWLSVNYGMVDEAKKLGVDLKVLEAGGYPNQAKQKEQLENCQRWKADAIILGTVAPDLYMNNLRQFAGDVPVFASVNELILGSHSRKQLKGEVGVDWYWMGYYTGQYLKDKHPQVPGLKRLFCSPVQILAVGPSLLSVVFSVRLKTVIFRLWKPTGPIMTKSFSETLSSNLSSAKTLTI